MAKEHAFARGETAPSWWANALMDFVDGFASPTFELAADPLSTTLKVPVDVAAGKTVLAINGRWRARSSDATLSVSGLGAAGTYGVFATAKETTIVSSPDPYTDATDRSFGLAVVAGSGTPAIVSGTVDVFRKIGVIEWSGSAIVGLLSLVGRGVDFLMPGMGGNTPAFGAGWSFVAPSPVVGLSRPVMYRRAGLVWLEGRVRNATDGPSASMWAIPAGWQPSGQRLFVPPQNTPVAVYGALIQAEAAPADSFVTLDGMLWRAV